ncbi:MAG: hydroxymethylbilane synthase [Alphaproteobacteria bacterium]|nr:hydroxymethylbilane synthase [Alphaproteobacteria bacterium]
MTKDLQTLRIGTRGSPLALWQANETKRLLAGAHPALAAPGAVEIRVIKTTGDRIQDRTLAEAGGKGLFTKEIEEAMIAREIDLAVHSMKDVPTWLPEGLGIVAVLEREDPRDALIAGPGISSIDDLRVGAVVGTASLRRGAQLLARRPDVKIVPLRGNVDTRIAKVERGEVEATFLAYAGLRRLGRTEAVRALMEPEDMLPAVAQGAIGIECRLDDQRTRGLLAAIDHAPTAIAVTAERGLLEKLDGSCRTPIGALAVAVAGDRLRLDGLVVRPDGSGLMTTSREGPVALALAMGRDAGEELKHRAGPGYFQ